MRVIGIFVAASMIIGVPAKAQEIDWKRVDDALGRSAAVTGDVHRYGFPRSDLHVTLDGVAIKPALALGGWVAFKPAHGGAMMMGDLVLLETEITPVMTTAIENGLEITAVHNHILRASPATFYMHVSGHGDPTKLVNALHKALAVSKTPLVAPAVSAASSEIGLDTAELDRIVGVKGKSVGGVYQVAVARREPITRWNVARTRGSTRNGDRRQLSADRGWSSSDYWRLRFGGQGGQSGNPRLAYERNRSYRLA